MPEVRLVWAGLVDADGLHEREIPEDCAEQATERGWLVLDEAVCGLPAPTLRLLRRDDEEDGA